jgi:predicted transcriptional regulator
MDANGVPQTARRRPRLNVYVKALRRERIFSRLRLGAPYADIARDEGVTERRVRQIVADALKRQEVDGDREHALLQLMRLESAQALAAESIAGGDLKAIPPYLKVLERLDRYQRPGATKHVYDDAARERLLAKLNRALTKLEAAEARKSARGAPRQPRLRPGT